MVFADGDQLRCRSELFDSSHSVGMESTQLDERLTQDLLFLLLLVLIVFFVVVDHLCFDLQATEHACFSSQDELLEASAVMHMGNEFIFSSFTDGHAESKLLFDLIEYFDVLAGFVFVSDDCLR